MNKAVHDPARRWIGRKDETYHRIVRKLEFVLSREQFLWFTRTNNAMYYSHWAAHFEKAHTEEGHRARVYIRNNPAAKVVGQIVMQTLAYDNVEAGYKP